MYNAIRKVHLYTGLVVLLFLMMYFVSGYVIIHRPWFGGQQGKPPANVRTEPLAGYAGSREPEALAAYLAERFELRGRVNVPPAARQPAKAIRFNVVRPGTIQQVEVPNDGDTVTITTTRENVAGVLAQLHRVHGYGGGWIWNAFVFFNDLASASCIVFALTGVYLWWKTVKRKIWGVLCLGASCAYTIGMIHYLMHAR
jgi:hypothetical protein